MNPTVVLADEFDVVRAGLRKWLTEADINVVGEAADGLAALEAVNRLRPKVLMLDVRLPKSDGLECLGRLREASNTTPVLYYSSAENPTYAARASALGAAGFLSKSTTKDVLVEAVRRVAAGQSVWPERISRRLQGSLVMHPPHEGPPGISLQAPLTTREVEVLKQLSFGLSNKEIAMALGISYETVKEHVQHILRKLSVSDRTQAAVWAVRHGMA